MEPIPNANLPLNSVMGIYSDLNPSTCGNVRYDTYGVAPCRRIRGFVECDLSIQLHKQSGQRVKLYCTREPT